MSNQIISDRPEFWSQNTWIQIGYCLWVNQASLVVGLAFGFSAVTIPKLSENETKFPTTLTEKAWIASVVVLTAPIGLISGGWLMDRFGRRIMLILCMIPLSIGWLYTGFAKRAIDLIIGRSITGLGVGWCASPPRTYATEISLPHIRGVNGVIPSLAIAAGIAIQALLGKWLGWKILCYICASYSAFLMFMNLFLPESPYFVLLTGSLEKTRRVLKKFRAEYYRINREIEQMRDFRDNNYLHQLTVKKQIRMLFEPCSYKPFLIIMVFIILSQISGVSVIIFWTVEIFQESKMSLDPFIGNIALGVTCVVGALITAALAFVVPRRSLALTSTCGVGCVSTGLATYLYIVKEASLYPLFFYMFFVLFSFLGMYSLPLLMLVELVPLQVRGLLVGIAVSLLYLCIFASNNSFPYVKRAIGLPATLLTSAAGAFVATLVLYFILPETMGLTLQEIEEYYRGRRPTLEHKPATQIRFNLRPRNSAKTDPSAPVAAPHSLLKIKTDVAKHTSFSDNTSYKD